MTANPHIHNIFDMVLRLKIILFFLLFPCLTQAATLDWNAAGVDWTTRWNNGTTDVNPVSQTFTNVNGSGIDITITIERNPTNTGPTEVQDTTNLPSDTTGPITLGGQRALIVDVDFTNRTNDYIKFTIAFSQPVTAVNFQIWDIDLGNQSAGVLSQYQDIVDTFSSNTGATATLSETGTDLALTGGGTIARGIASDGDSTAYGNENDTLGTGILNATYGTAFVSDVSFFYRSGNGSGSGTTWSSTDPTLQRIALADINFTIPEPSTWIMAALLGCLILGQALRSRLQQQ